MSSSEKYTREKDVRVRADDLGKEVVDVECGGDECVVETSSKVVSNSSSAAREDGIPTNTRGWTCRSCRCSDPRVTFSTRVFKKVRRKFKRGLVHQPICIACSNLVKKDSNLPLRKCAAIRDVWTTHPEAVARIRGLSYYAAFFTEDEAARAIRTIDKNPWLNVIGQRRQQFYGEIYYHTTTVNPLAQPEDAKRDALALSEWSWLRRKLEATPWKRRVFGDSSFPTQILINEYIGDAGISTHFEDEAAFGDVIATISLVSPICMTLERPRVHTNQCADLIEKTKVLLEPRSLFVMSDACRFEWRHGISHAKRVPLPDGSFILRDPATYRRVSITIRHLKSGRRRWKELDEDEDDETCVSAVPPSSISSPS